MHKGRRQVLSRRRRMTQVLLVLNGSGLMNSNVESSLQSGRRCTMQATFNSVDLTNIDQRSTRLGEERHGSYATLLLLGCKGLSVRSLTKWEACWKWSRVRNQYCFFFFFFFFFLHPTSHFHTGTRRQRPVGSCGILTNSLSNANAGEDSIFFKMAAQCCGPKYRNKTKTLQDNFKTKLALNEAHTNGQHARFPVSVETNTISLHLIFIYLDKPNPNPTLATKWNAPLH